MNLVKILQVNQWRNSDSVIKLFDSIENKFQSKFICWILYNFTPISIRKKIDNAILFAQYIDIPEKELCIIKHSKKSLLYNDNEPWEEKIQRAASTSPWAVLMVPKFVGLSGIHIILFLLSKRLDKQSTGL